MDLLAARREIYRINVNRSEVHSNETPRNRVPFDCIQSDSVCYFTCPADTFLGGQPINCHISGDFMFQRHGQN